jgi:WhiB family transcriptional regulator, redox-sensing transcriptional regulator
VTAAPISTRSRLLPRRDWEWDAECKGEPPEVFFGSGEHAITSAEAQAGRWICQRCVVQRDCLLVALLTGERKGLMGGFLPHERAATLRRHGGDVAAAMADFDAGVFYRPASRRRQ